MKDSTCDPAVSSPALPPGLKQLRLGWQSLADPLQWDSAVAMLRAGRDEFARYLMDGAHDTRLAQMEQASRSGDLQWVQLLPYLAPTAEDFALRSIIHERVSRSARAEPDVSALAAAIMYLSPHHLPRDYSLEALPRWFLDHYLSYLVTHRMWLDSPGEEDTYTDYMEDWTGYVLNKLQDNPSDPFWSDISDVVFKKSGYLMPCFSRRNLVGLFKARAAFLELYAARCGCKLDYIFTARTGRSRIRLGILLWDAEPRVEAFATLPVYRDLDRTQFEVILILGVDSEIPFARHCKQFAERVVVLEGSSLGTIAAEIRALDLDAIWLGNNSSAMNSHTAVLVSHRLARVQIASACWPATTGLRNVDIFISGARHEPDGTAQQHYTEQLRCVRGMGICFDFGDEMSHTPTIHTSRDKLGIAPKDVVFVSGSNLFKLGPETMNTWMEILKAVPNAFLVLYPFNPNWSQKYPAQFFHARIVALAKQFGIHAERIIILHSFPHIVDVREMLKVGDIYLDAFPFTGMASIMDAFAAHLPVIAMEGDALRSMQAVALLKTVGLEDLIARDARSYIERAVSLAGNRESRERYSAQLKTRLEQEPEFLNPKWYAGEVGRIVREAVTVWK